MGARCVGDGSQRSRAIGKARHDGSEKDAAGDTGIHQAAA